jgi:hypothetical protein
MGILRTLRSASVAKCPPTPLQVARSHEHHGARVYPGMGVIDKGSGRAMMKP